MALSTEFMIRNVIKDTLNEVINQGWDLIDEATSNSDKAVEMVYSKIKGKYTFDDDNPDGCGGCCNHKACITCTNHDQKMTEK
jgi:hypothetical protein